MGEHTVTVTFEDGFPRYTFTCNAGPESLCHARYTCDCETWYDHSIRNGVPAHRPDPFDEESWHAGVFDADECFHKSWFDEADDAPLDGEVTFPVNPVWQDDYETFDITTPVLTPTDADRKLAAVRDDIQVEWENVYLETQDKPNAYREGVRDGLRCALAPLDGEVES